MGPLKGYNDIQVKSETIALVLILSVLSPKCHIVDIYMPERPQMLHKAICSEDADCSFSSDSIFMGKGPRHDQSNATIINFFVTCSPLKYEGAR